MYSAYYFYNFVDTDVKLFFCKNFQGHLHKLTTSEYIWPFFDTMSCENSEKVCPLFCCNIYQETYSLDVIFNHIKKMSHFLQSVALFLPSFFGMFQNDIPKGSIKRFRNDFFETSYPKRYWPEKYDPYTKCKLKLPAIGWWSLLWDLLVKNEEINFSKDHSQIFWRNLPRFFLWKVLKNDARNSTSKYI